MNALRYFPKISSPIETYKKKYFRNIIKNILNFSLHIQKYVFDRNWKNITSYTILEYWYLMGEFLNAFYVLLNAILYFNLCKEHMNQPWEFTKRGMLLVKWTHAFFFCKGCNKKFMEP